MVILNYGMIGSHVRKCQTLTGTKQVANRFPASLMTLIVKTLRQATLMIACRRNLVLIGQAKLNRYRLIQTVVMQSQKLLCLPVTSVP